MFLGFFVDKSLIPIMTYFAMHRVYATRINSRSMSRVFCDLRSQKTPRGMLPVNSNENYTLQRKENAILYFKNRELKLMG